MDAQSFDLNGRWIDVNATGHPEITITHELNANTVRAEYGEVRQCKDWDGSLLMETKFDFEGTLIGNEIKGQINVCNFGERPLTKGWVLEQLELTVSDDGELLDGQYFCRVDKNWVPVTFTRKRFHGLDAQLGGIAARVQEYCSWLVVGWPTPWPRATSERIICKERRNPHGRSLRWKTKKSNDLDRLFREYDRDLNNNPDHKMIQTLNQKKIFLTKGILKTKDKDEVARLTREKQKLDQEIDKLLPKVRPLENSWESLKKQFDDAEKDLNDCLELHKNDKGDKGGGQTR